VDGYEVLTGELDAHAGKIDSLPERLRTASDAASQVTMNDSAYGVLCQPFAAMLQPFEELGVRTLRQGGELHQHRHQWVDLLPDPGRRVVKRNRVWGSIVGLPDGAPDHGR